MSVFTDWLGKTLRITDGGWMTAFYGSRNSTGKPVTQDTVLSIAAAWACLRIISETVGVLPLFLYKRLPDGSRVPAPEHAVYGLIHDRPNPDMTALEYWGCVAACLAGHGNAFGMKLKVGSRTVGLEIIDPRTVSVTRYPLTKELRYQFPFRGAFYDLTSADVLHWRAFSFGGDRSPSPIACGANTFGIAMAADDAAGSTFKNSSNSSGFIQAPNVLKPEQRAQFRASLTEFQGDTNAGKLMLLEGGFEFKEFGIDPNELQLLQARGFSIEQVCSIFRVPPFLIGHTEKSTSWGTGLEQTVQGFLTFTLLPYLKNITKRIDLALLSTADRANGYYTEFAIEGLLQADSAARASFYSTMTQNGLMTRDEARLKENLPKKGGNADVLTVQSALVSLDDLGKAPLANDANAAKNAVKNWLGVKEEDSTPPKK